MIAHSRFRSGGVEHRLERVAPLDLVRLTPLLERTSGSPDIAIGLLDGRVAANHPDLNAMNLRAASEKVGAVCGDLNSAACLHGTFVAGILSARRGSVAPAICPGCTVLVRPIYEEVGPEADRMLSVTPERLAEAIFECVDAGARVLNLSSAFAHSSSKSERVLEEALDYAGKRSVIVVAAAGNEGIVGSSAITRHSGVIPVASCDLRGWPIRQSNFGSSIGRRGLLAPGDRVISLGTRGSIASSGTSVAAPFVTGAIALLWSEFPAASAAEIRRAVTRTPGPRRTSVVPPLLDAWSAYQDLARTYGRR